MQKNRTLMVGISALKGEFSDQIPLFTAGIVIAAAPIVVLYVIFQRRIVSGIAVGAVKG
jgi:multiple sugar transport system permease protein